jgi:hypothetical protein
MKRGWCQPPSCHRGKMHGCKRNDAHCWCIPCARYVGVIAERWGIEVGRCAETAELMMVNEYLKQIEAAGE